VAVRKVGWALIALVAATSALPLAAVAAQEPTGPAPLGRQPSEYPRLATSLRDDLAAGAPVVPAGSAVAGSPAASTESGDDVTVAVEGTSTEAARMAVEQVGGTVTVELDGIVQADVPAAALGALSRAHGVELVREPRPAVPAATSEGVASTGSAAWTGAGWGGAGVKIAIVDVGFAGWSSRVGVGAELGAPVSTDFGRCANPEFSDHGTGVAEIVHDMAPEAEVHLVCVETDLEFISALQGFAALGVDIVNGSIGWTAVGRGDGSGNEFITVAGAVRALRRQGILYVASAGNYGETHWHGPAVGDSDGPGSQDHVNLTTHDTIRFTVGPNETGAVSVQWDEYVGPVTDFDLYVGNSTCGYFGSEFDQVAGVGPIEYTAFQNCTGAPQAFEIFINRYAGGGTPRLDVFVDGVVCCMEAATASSSLPEPASSSAALTVGAACWSDGTHQPYSSQGPTIDGRLKPDLTAPDATTTSVHGTGSDCSHGFIGTSASAPHVAGAAAQVLGRNPNLDVAELQQLLVDRAQDAGAAGDDNVFGAGHVRLGPVDAAGAAAPRSPQPFTSIPPVRLLDTRPGLSGVAEVPARSTPIGGGVGAMYALPVTGVAGVPADASAVVLNVTVTEPSNHSYVAVQPGTNQPTTSNVNFVPGQTVAQHVTATVGSDGKVRIYNNFGTAHVVVDVSGWYGPTGTGGTPATARFSSLPAPARALDTRGIGTGYAESPARSSPLSAGVPYELPLSGLAGVPSGATGVVLNVTITESTALAHLNVFPADQPLPISSSVNVAAGQTVANLVVVKLSGGANPGRIRLQLSSGSAHVVVDTIGWFQSGVGAGYVSLDPPARQIDSRFGTGPRLGALGSSEIHEQEIGRYQGVPADAEAVMLSVVAVTPTAGGFLTIFPSGASRPVTSNLNFTPGTIVPNAVVAGLGASGRVSYYNHFGLTHVVSDVSGYFLDPLDAPAPRSSPAPGLASWEPPQVVRDGPTTVYYQQSQPGDWVGQGRTLHFTNANALLDVLDTGGTFHLVASGDVAFGGDFSPGPDVAQIVPDDYQDLGRYPIQKPGLSWAGEGRGCNEVFGRYIVDHALYEDGQLDELTVRFEQRCERATAPLLRGFFRYDADDPTT
jgi:hypothetical protein